MLRIGLIGCGQHSEVNHAVALARLATERPGETCLAAACDLDREKAEKIRRKYGFGQAYDNLERMLDRENLDACVCVMPAAKIVEMATYLLRRGMPCTIEKPLGGSREEMRGLVQVARETGTPHIVSTDRRFNPFLRRALDWARERGPIRFVLGSVLRSANLGDNAARGKVFHPLDTFRHIAGEIESYKGEVLVAPELTSHWVHLSFCFASGALGHLELLPTAGLLEERYDLHGERPGGKRGTGFRASVCFRAMNRESQVRCWENDRLVVEESSMAEMSVSYVNGTYHETEAFLTALLERRRPFPGVEDVAPSMEIGFAMGERFGARAELLARPPYPGRGGVLEI